MKVAFIGQKGIPAVSGGVETYVEKLSTRMVDLGHEVFVYVRNNYTDKNIKEYRRVKLIHLPSISTKHLDAITHTFLATIHALFQNYDVVHYQGIGPTSLCWIIKTLKRNTVVLTTFQCQDYFHQKWGWFARLYLKFGEYISCKFPDKTIVVTKILQKYVIRKYKADAIVVPNGAEIRQIKGNQALVKFGLREKQYILSVSRLIKHKGIHYLIEAFKKLEDTSRLPNDFKLVIVGDGFHTDEYVKYLKFMSAGRKNIIFTGNQTGDKLNQLFANAYLFVQPSESEGLSMALLEAMGHGTATLVSNIPENLEAIGKTGFTFKSKDVNDLKNKLAYLLVKPVEVSLSSKAAKERIEKEFGWDSIARKIADIYNELISQKKDKLKFYVQNSRKI